MERGREGAFPPGHGEGRAQDPVPFLTRRVPVEVQNQMPFMSNRTGRSEFSEDRGAPSSFFPAVKGLIPA
jgi:hypothetical protein